MKQLMRQGVYILMTILTLHASFPLEASQTDNRGEVAINIPVGSAPGTSSEIVPPQDENHKQPNEVPPSFSDVGIQVEPNTISVQMDPAFRSSEERRGAQQSPIVLIQFLSEQRSHRREANGEQQDATVLIQLPHAQVQRYVGEQLPLPHRSEANEVQQGLGELVQHPRAQVQSQQIEADTAEENNRENLNRNIPGCTDNWLRFLINFYIIVGGFSGFGATMSTLVAILSGAFENFANLDPKIREYLGYTTVVANVFAAAFLALKAASKAAKEEKREILRGLLRDNPQGR